MAPSIGVNLRVTGHCSQGGRKYMEDMFSVAYQQTDDEKDLEYAFFGIFDGHGGREAATFAKEHLLDFIVNQKGFWSDKDEDILRAIREGFLQTHLAMWGQLEFWSKTPSGLPSTSGTTASIAFIRKGKIYIGHVGDSSIVLGYQDEGETSWRGRALTRDHKPESREETYRIEKSGGKVVSKSGVPRVVWNRPRLGHKGPVRRSTPIDEIPFLAVARSLGDLWSYNPALDVFVVSPEPDIGVVTIDIRNHRCLIFGTDGLWNVLSPGAAVSIVQAAESHNEKHVLHPTPAQVQMWVNPSKSLVDQALARWSATRLRADNTSVVTLMLDPPGPPRAQVLLNQKQQQHKDSVIDVPGRHPHLPKITEPKSGVVLHTMDNNNTSSSPEPLDNYDPTGGVAIFTRFPVPYRHSIAGDSTTVPSPDSSSSPGNGRVCKVSDVLHREPGGRQSDSPKLPQQPEPSSVQINEVSSSMEENTAPSKRNEVADVRHTIMRQKAFAFNGNCSENFGKIIGFKRRHSSIAKLLEVDCSPDVSSNYEPCQKRRTRSEDKRLPAPPIDEELSTSDAENERVTWPVKWNKNSSEIKVGSASGSRVNVLGPSRYVVSKLASKKSILSGYEAKQENTRMLRSDTAAATPVRTLRSRNIDILQSAGQVLSKRVVHRVSLRRTMGENLRSARVSETAKGLQKRHRHTCWPVARPMTTRSRVRQITK